MRCRVNTGRVVGGRSQGRKPQLEGHLEISESARELSTQSLSKAYGEGDGGDKVGKFLKFPEENIF